MSTSLDGHRRRVRGQARTAFVLSGGGNQGVSQIGMLRALIERDIIPDVVVGTSAGALNGAAIAAEPTVDNLDRLAELWCSLQGTDVFPGSKLSRAWNVLRRDSHLFPNSGLAAVVYRSLSVRTFAELALPLRVIATDLDTGEEVVFAQGPLGPALLASAALPGVFPSIRHDDRMLVDGAVVNSVPLWHALAGPVDRVYVLNVSGSVADKAARSPLDVVLRAFAISRNQRFDLELRHAPPEVDIMVLPRPIDPRDVFDFSGARALIDEAYRLTSRALDFAGQRISPRRRAWFRRTAIA
ncbi:MAG: patatin-like phospholipase family protein [Acidimicrobiia bacterium]